MRVSIALSAIALLAAFALPAPALALAGAQAAPATTSALPRVIALEGVSNFRDLGGYRTTDGRQVRSGLVFRSGGTDKLTPADFRTIRGLGIRLFCDLRESAERQPEFTAGAKAPQVLTWPDRSSSALKVDSPEAARQAMIEMYRGMPEHYAQPVGDIFRRIAKGDVPLVFNCTAGKDRTGFTAAVLLRALGVPREAVMADYLASNRYFIGAQIAYDPNSHSHPALGGQTIDADTMAVFTRVEAEWLDASFAAIDARYGSVHGYLKRGLGLSDLEIATIKRRMLEPASRK